MLALFDFGYPLIQIHSIFHENEGQEIRVLVFTEREKSQGKFSIHDSLCVCVCDDVLIYVDNRNNEINQIYFFFFFLLYIEAHDVEKKNENDGVSHWLKNFIKGKNEKSI